MPSKKIDPIYIFVGIVVFLVVLWFIVLPMFNKSSSGPSTKSSFGAASASAVTNTLVLSGYTPNSIKPAYLIGIAEYMPSLGILGPQSFAPYNSSTAMTSTTTPLTPNFFKIGAGVYGSGKPGLAVSTAFPAVFTKRSIVLNSSYFNEAAGYYPSVVTMPIVPTLFNANLPNLKNVVSGIFNDNGTAVAPATLSNVRHWNNQFVFHNYSASTFIHIEVRVPNFQEIPSITSSIAANAGKLNTNLPYLCPFNTLNSSAATNAAFNTSMAAPGKPNSNAPFYLSTDVSSSETSCTTGEALTYGKMSSNAETIAAQMNPAKYNGYAALGTNDIYCDFNLHLAPFGYYQGESLVYDATGIRTTPAAGVALTAGTVIPTNMSDILKSGTSYAAVSTGSPTFGTNLYSKQSATAIAVNSILTTMGAIRLPPVPSPWCIPVSYTAGSMPPYFANSGWDGIANQSTGSGVVTISNGVVTSDAGSIPSFTNHTYTPGSLAFGASGAWFQPIANTALYVYYKVPETKYQLAVSGGLSGLGNALPSAIITGGGSTTGIAGSTNWGVRVNTSPTVTMFDASSSVIPGTPASGSASVTVAITGIMTISKVNNHYLFPLGAYTQVPAIGNSTSTVADIIDTYGLRVFQVCDDVMATIHLPSTVCWGDLFLS